MRTGWDAVPDRESTGRWPEMKAGCRRHADDGADERDVGDPMTYVYVIE